MTMKKMFLMFAAALLSCMLACADDAKKNDFKGPSPTDVVFVGVNDIRIVLDDSTGKLILEARIEYCNRGVSDIIVAGLQGKALLIDKDIDSEELYSMVYSDFYTSARNGEIIPALKKYECGDYIPEATSLRKSVKFDKCNVNEATGVYENKTAVFKFDIGTIINNDLTNEAASKVAGFAADNSKVANYGTIRRLLKISNTMNDEFRNSAKLVFVIDGIANATKIDESGHASTTVELGEMRMANVQGRAATKSIFINRAYKDGMVSGDK
jgi:hypothetical protein